MTNKDKELLLLDLCARLPHGVKVLYDAFIGKFNNILVLHYYNGTDKVQNADGWIDFFRTGKQIEIEKFKPFLRSLSSMTDDEKADFRSIGGVISYNPQHDHYAISAFSPEAYDWLNRNHFDYRNLIKKGLAIEVTEENNPY